LELTMTLIQFIKLRIADGYEKNIYWPSEPDKQQAFIDRRINEMTQLEMLEMISDFIEEERL